MTQLEDFAFTWEPRFSARFRSPSYLTRNTAPKASLFTSPVRGLFPYIRTTASHLPQDAYLEQGLSTKQGRVYNYTLPTSAYEGTNRHILTLICEE
jgi:hypothetical protein